MSETPRGPMRAIVIDPATSTVENVILVEDEDFSLPGRIVRPDKWGASPGDVWDPAGQRAYRPIKEVETSAGDTAVIVADQARAILEAHRNELEAALAAGDLEAAMEIILRVHTALKELSK